MNYSRILEHAIESLKSEGRHNQADILRDVLQAYNAQVEAIEAAREAIDLALNWGPKTQSDEYLVETRLREALTKLGG
jgi:collagenase-like PrtC family protease